MRLSKSLEVKDEVAAPVETAIMLAFLPIDCAFGFFSGARLVPDLVSSGGSDMPILTGDCGSLAGSSAGASLKPLSIISTRT